MASFSKQVADANKRNLERIAAARRRAVTLLADEMTRTKPQGGRVPFLTGTLARSLVASVSGMPKTSAVPTPAAPVGLTVIGLPANQPVWLGYTVRYARRRNYGFIGADSLGRVYNEAGDYFVEGAMAEWPRIVRQAVQEVRRGS